MFSLLLTWHVLDLDSASALLFIIDPAPFLTLALHIIWYLAACLLSIQLFLLFWLPILLECLPGYLLHQLCAPLYVPASKVLTSFLSRTIRLSRVPLSLDQSSEHYCCSTVSLESYSMLQVMQVMQSTHTGTCVPPVPLYHPQWGQSRRYKGGQPRQRSLLSGT